MNNTEETVGLRVLSVSPGHHDNNHKDNTVLFVYHYQMFPA